MHQNTTLVLSKILTRGLYSFGAIKKITVSIYKNIKEKLLKLKIRVNRYVGYKFDLFIAKSFKKRWKTIFIDKPELFDFYLDEMRAWQIKNHLSSLVNKEELIFNYVNWKGEEGQRRVSPVRVWFGATEFHVSRQWFMLAYDLDKKQMRDFTIKDMGIFNK